jgi:ribonuclease D
VAERSAPEGRWIDRDEQLVPIVEELIEAEAFAVDTEFHRERTYFPQLALVQIAWAGGIALIDPLAVDLAPLAPALTGPAVVVMHAATQDLEVLDRACGVLPRELFDTQIAAGFVSATLPALAALVERTYGVSIPKGDRLTDWLHRPLGEDQRIYAAADVEFLLDLRAKLGAQLEERGRLSWAADEFEALRQRGRVIRDPEQAWTRIKEARSLRGEAAGVARTVAAWRERRAAEIDQPVRYVMSDMAVVAIAQRRPTNAADLARIRGVDERHARGSTAESLLAAVIEGRSNPPARSETSSRELDRRLRPAVALVAAWVGQLARDLEIEASLVATRADIESLLAGDPASRLNRGWRSDLVGARIRDLVEGRAALSFDGKGNLLLEDRIRP